MNALKSVFPDTPSLLCKWHINKDVLAYSKRHFPDGEAGIEFHKEWVALTMSDTEAGYTSSWHEFRAKYLVNQPEAVHYLEKTWLQYDRKTISCYTDKYFHLGSGTSSGVEGAHATMKSYLRSSMGDLYLVMLMIRFALDNQLVEIQAAFAKSMEEKKHHLCSEFYS